MLLWLPLLMLLFPMLLLLLLRTEINVFVLIAEDTSIKVTDSPLTHNDMMTLSALLYNHNAQTIYG